MKNTLVLCHVLIAIATVSATDYCKQNCTVDGKVIGHVGCGKDESFGPDCSEFAKWYKISKAQRDVFLREINVLRNYVAGGVSSPYNYLPACRMATIQWDSQLAKNAEFNVKECKKWYDLCHKTDTFPSSGQLVMEINNTKASRRNETIVNAISIWAAKTHSAGFGDLLADRNIRLGCAITIAPAEFKIRIRGTVRFFNTYWIVCNFATAVQNRESMYEVCKTPAEKCKNKPIAPYPNLCSVEEIYE